MAVDPASMAVGVGGAVLGPILGLIGNLFAQGDRDAAMRLREQAMQEFNIELPDVKDIAARTVQTRPEDAQTQRDVYGELLERGRSGELRMADRARLNEIQNQNAIRERGARGAILDSFAARGMGGSGTELAALLSNQQASADRNSREGLQVAGMADERADRNLLQAAGLAGDVRGQDFREAGYNADALRDADVFNVGQRNTRFGQEMDLASARANAFKDMADAREGRAAQTQGTWGGMGQAVTAGTAGIAQYLNSRNRSWGW